MFITSPLPKRVLVLVPEVAASWYQVSQGPIQHSHKPYLGAC
jgi:hypothetical protein